MTFTEFATKLETQGISRQAEKPTLNFCFCDYECEYMENVFVDLADDDDIKNDRTTFLAMVEDGSLNFTLEVTVPDGSTVVLNDATFGSYFAIGYVPTNPLKGGFVLQWRLLAAVHGFGCYSFTLTTDQFSGSLVEESWTYVVQPYDEEFVDGTIRIETVSEGCIEGGIDYTDLNWFRSIRLEGSLSGVDPVMNVTNIFTNNYKQKQVRTTVVDEYSMEVRMAPEEVLNPLVHDHLLANTVLVTDYNVWSWNIIRQLEIYVEEVSSTSYPVRSKKATYVMKCIESTQNNIKRN